MAGEQENETPHDVDNATSPIPLEYRDGAREADGARRPKVWQGLLAGFGLSAFWWFGGVNQYFHYRQGMGLFGGMVLLGALKLIAAVTALFLPKWRRFGIGLLLSIGLVILIFAGTCFAMLSRL